MRDLPTWLRIGIAALVFLCSTTLHVAALLIVAVLKALLPFRAVRSLTNSILMAISESWIGVNSALIRHLTHTQVVLHLQSGLQLDGHYLVMANHQSWVDIPMLQMVFNQRIPLLRFFLKSQLFWIPLLGLAWWALDFPFMKRYTREQLARKPALAGRDVEATRRACRKFRDIPVAVMNFVEGTRFTAAKHTAQQSPFRHLLKPRAGGVAFVIAAMGDALQAILDVTIVYSGPRPSFADLFADRVGTVHIHVRELPVPHEFVGRDYQNDAEFREAMQGWINMLWTDKDATMESLSGHTPGNSHRA